MAVELRAARRLRQIDPFADESAGEVKYRTLAWWQASLLMIAETISLGILSLPSVLASLGMIPGVILIVGRGICATYTGFVFGQFKLAYPAVSNMADAGEVLMGAIRREVLGTAQIVFLIFVLGSHLFAFTIAMNRITGHATCTIVWGVVGLVACFMLSIPRMLKNVSYLSIGVLISIVGSVFITIIAVGIQTPGSVVQGTTTIGFQPAISATMNICFAYPGHMAFFKFISEMRKPTDVPKALIGLQSVEISLYLICAITIYRFAGPDVTSPALGATSNVVKKVAYGVALRTIFIARVIHANICAKQIYVRIFRRTPSRMNEKSGVTLWTWVAIIGVLWIIACWIIAWIIAESTPVFNDLNTLIVALFASWFTYGIADVLWLYMNHGKWFSNWKKTCPTILNMFLSCMGAAICGIGLYASGKAIHDNSGRGGSWSCVDNS